MTESDVSPAVPAQGVPLSLQVILAPRRVMRWILANRGSRRLLPLVFVTAFSMTLGDLSRTFASRGRSGVVTLGEAAAAFPDTPLFIAGVALAAIVLWILAVLVVFYAFSGLATVTGRFVGGTGTAAAVRSAVAWGTAPIAWALLYRIPAVLFWGGAYRVLQSRSDAVLVREGRGPGFNLDLSGLPGTPFYQLVILFVIETLFLALYLFVGSRTLAEAQGISSWNGLANLLLAFLLPVAVVVALALAVVLAGI